ncbi:MAG: transposase [bacterium]|nr:transposase [bacterium]
MRTITFSEGNFYHLYNKGSNVLTIFRGDEDKWRFIFLILYLQSDVSFPHVTRAIDNFKKGEQFGIDEFSKKEIERTRSVELIAFTVLPDHFHLIVKKTSRGKIATYMKRVQNAYAKYFNAKYKKTGHVFNGPYKGLRLNNKEEMLLLSSFIHLEPGSQKIWRHKEHGYPWSSLQDCIKTNRWLPLLANEEILDQFSSDKEFKKFLEKSSSLDFREVLGPAHIM